MATDIKSAATAYAEAEALFNSIVANEQKIAESLLVALRQAPKPVPYMQYAINDATTYNTPVVLNVFQEGARLHFIVAQPGAAAPGDITGVVFDVPDSLLGKFRISGGDGTQKVVMGNNLQNAIGTYNNLKGLTPAGGDKNTTWDVQIQVGVEGLKGGADYYPTYEFYMSRTDGTVLPIDILNNLNFGVRIQSLDGASFKGIETLEKAILPELPTSFIVRALDTQIASETGFATRIFADIAAKFPGYDLQVRSWSFGGATYKAGETIILDKSLGTSLTIGLDGTLRLSGAGAIAESYMETLSSQISLTVAVANRLDPGSAGITSTTLGLFRVGTNQSDFQHDAAYSVDENNQATFNLALNTERVDRLDYFLMGEYEVRYQLITADGTVTPLPVEIGSIVSIDKYGDAFADGSKLDFLSAGYVLQAIVDYNMLDQFALSTNRAIATLNFVGLNDGPTAGGDAAAADENATALGNVLANDRDPDIFDKLTVSAWSGGAIGEAAAIEGAAGATVTLNADGSYILDASAADALAEGETITQTFRYTADDGHGGTSEASFTVTLTGRNDDPTAIGDSAATSEDAAVSANVRDNDTDPDRGDMLSVFAVNGAPILNADGTANTVFRLASGAVVTMTPDGNYTYDPHGAFNGLRAGEAAADSFTYTISDGHGGFSTAAVTVAITGENDAPTANNDSAETFEDATVTINALANDTDPDNGDTLSLFAVNGEPLFNADGTANTTFKLVSGAIVTIDSAGNFVYDPNHAFDALNTGESATDSFTYTIRDSSGAESTATVTVAIAGVTPEPELPTLGLSHGYWKTHDGDPNADDWNIAHDTSFEEYFGVDTDWITGSGKTRVTLEDLLFDEAIEAGGGGKYALAREGVTGILNALDEKNGTVYDFAYTADQVVRLVQDAFASGSYDSATSLLLVSHE